MHNRADTRSTCLITIAQNEKDSSNPPQNERWAATKYKHARQKHPLTIRKLQNENGSESNEERRKEEKKNKWPTKQPASQQWSKDCNA